MAGARSKSGRRHLPPRFPDAISHRVCDQRPKAAMDGAAALDPHPRLAVGSSIDRSAMRSKAFEALAAAETNTHVVIAGHGQVVSRDRHVRLGAVAIADGRTSRERSRSRPCLALDRCFLCDIFSLALLGPRRSGHLSLTARGSTRGELSRFQCRAISCLRRTSDARVLPSPCSGAHETRVTIPFTSGQTVVHRQTSHALPCIGPWPSGSRLPVCAVLA